MAIDVRLSFVCAKQFSELEGDSDLKRYCSACSLDVINLDVLNAEAQLAVFETAAKSPIQVCVCASTPLENSRDCTTSVRAAPLPLTMPSKEELDAQISSVPTSPFARLIAKLKFW